MMAAKKHTTKRWVKNVKTDSTHPPEGLFTKSPTEIARVGLKESLAQRPHLGPANADLLHQSRWQRTERHAPCKA